MNTLGSLVLEFEQHFGDERSPDTLFSWANALISDDISRFPDDQVDALNHWGMAAYYVPAELGGKLSNFSELAMLIRLIARRDLTVAIGHGKTFLGAVSVWVGGDAAQRHLVAEDILSCDMVSLALTERLHGSDVSSTEVTAVKTPKGFRLNGEKYLINNATRGQALSVFARTDHQGQSRDFSLFLVRKKDHPPQSFSQVPKAVTHGIKGADISGIQFQNLEVNHDALIGKEGHGLDITLKGFQLSRTLCAALSCGAADTGLRLAVEFAQQRRSGNQALIDIANIRQVLATSATQMYIADIATQVISRAIQCFPQQMSLLSAVAKASVPVLCETMMESLSDVLGVRSYVQLGEQTDIFGKMLRDIRLISLFDGNTAVNLQAIALQLPTLARHREKSVNAISPQMLDALFCIDTELPTFDRDSLSLFTMRGDWLAAGLKRAESMTGECPVLTEKLVQIQARLTELDGLVQALPVELGHPSAQRFSLAKRYCNLQLAAMTLLTFLYNRNRLSRSFRSFSWVEECIDLLLGNQDALKDMHCLKLVRQQLDDNNLFSPLNLSIRGEVDAKLAQTREDSKATRAEKPTKEISYV
ncbi:acyl-CoA dehydrogenase [Shewanella psychrophila]|uniref:Acyl-CoA dehydrogenase n=1 Tax=Shewanella psychrophila TaxID=225848 RepID=A0A1S6HIT4_9GAMM|nr:acyl-CoA dehydrogenase family protein [Shewanella psychrophila]AQS35443.1 acyl-CoA dehydrogenase [Shewanella psychrophila]